MIGHISAYLTLSMLFAASLQSACMTFDRYDVVQRWTIDDKSAACKLNNSIHNHDDRYSLKAAGKDLIVQEVDFSLDFNDNWISEKFNYEYSISINKKTLRHPHFLTIVPTSDNKLSNTYAFDKADGQNFFRRTIYYIHEDEIQKEGGRNSIIMLIFLCSIFGSFLILSITSRVINFGLTLMAALIVSTSLATGLWLILDYWKFVGLLFGLGMFSLVLAIVNWKFFHAVGSICFGLVAIIYIVVGTSIEYKYSFPVVAFILACSSGVFVWRLEKMVFYDKFKFFGLHYFYWLLQYAFWSQIFIIYPAELYLRMRTGDWFYPMGRTGANAMIYIPMIATGLGVLILSILSGVIANARTRKAGFGPDSGNEGYRPLI